MDDFFSSLYDKASGLFDKVTDIELGKWQLDIIKNANAQEAALNQNQQPVGVSTVPGNTLVWVAVGGAVLVGAVLLLRK